MIQERKAGEEGREIDQAQNKIERDGESRVVSPQTSRCSGPAFTSCSMQFP